MTAAPARWPDAPADVSSLTDPGAAFDAAVDAACFTAISDLRRVLHCGDGSLQITMLRVAAELAAIGEMEGEF